LHDGHVLAQSLPPSIYNQLIEAQLISSEDRIETLSANRFLIHALPHPINIQLNGGETKLFCQIDGRNYELYASPPRFTNYRLWRSLDEEIPSHYLVENYEGTPRFIFEDGSISDTIDGSRKLVKIHTSPFGSFAEGEDLIGWKERDSIQKVDKFELPAELEFM